jgi:hypothetical protein
LAFVEFLLKLVDLLGRRNLVLAGIALFTVVMLWTKHRDDRVDFLLSMVVTSPFLAGLLALPVMDWMKLFLYDAGKAAAFGGKRHMYYSSEIRLKYVKGHPWIRLSDVCKILGITHPEKLVKRMSGQECDSIDTDFDWLSELGVKKLSAMPLGPEAAKFCAWFEKEYVKPAAKMRDKGQPLG